MRNYNVKDGLPGSDLYGVMQDSKGYIWTIGHMGISRFDGYEFKSYNTENGLPENTVLKMYEDRKQRMWFCTLSGKLCYFEHDSMYTLPCNEKLSTLVGSAAIASIYIDEGDTTWLGTNNSIIIKIKPGRRTEDLEARKLYNHEYIYVVERGHIIFGGSSFNKHLIKIYNRQYLLEPFNFFRIHNSCLINLAHVSKYIKGDGGYVMMSDGESCEVSRRKKNELLNRLSLIRL